MRNMSPLVSPWSSRVAGVGRAFRLSRCVLRLNIAPQETGVTTHAASTELMYTERENVMSVRF